MSQIIKYTLNELRLKFRFACRRLGLPQFQIHQIRLDEHHLIYIPIPKNGCTTIKQELYRIEFGKYYKSVDPWNEPFGGLHDYYNKRPDSFTGLKQLKRCGGEFTRFAVVRDPVDRLLSCYRNRVLELRDLHRDRKAIEANGLSSEPDLNGFALNLAKYRNLSKGIEHHTRPQYQFLEGNLSILDEVFTMEEFSRIEEFLKTFDPQVELLTRKSGGRRVEFSELSDEALDHVVDFYQRDYEMLQEFYSPPNRSQSGSK